jgi:hypothetical protein
MGVMMLLHKYLSLFFVFAGLACCAGCARYKAEPLGKAVVQGAAMPKSRVSFAYHVFTKNDCKRYLGRDVLAKGYQPILITFANNTRQYFRFLRSNISLPTVPASMVARRVHTKTLERSMGYGVVGIVLWALIVPAVVDGVRSYVCNYKLDQDFAHKELTDQLVGPFGSINGIIFVPKDKFSKDFTINVIDAETDTAMTLHRDNVSGEIS